MKLSAGNIQPGTWWLLAIVITVLATASSQPWFLLFLLACCFSAMYFFRDNTLRSKSLGFYSLLAASVVLVRFVFRIIFNQPDSFQQTALELPIVHFLGLQFFGPVSSLNLQTALVEGLKLASIIVAIGAANTIASPRKLLRNMPAALYEFATAAAVAINLAPQLIESLHRVKRARSLRSSARGFKAFRTIIIPVLEDSLGRSLALSASMESRGFGRQANVSKASAVATKASALIAVLLLTIASYSLLATSDVALAVAEFCAALIFLVFYLKLQNARKLHTKYRPQRFGLQDFVLLVVVSSILIAMQLA